MSQIARAYSPGMTRLVTYSGADYLRMATSLLQRVRATHPTAGLWEAADLQWWWRTERESDWLQQAFWLDDDDAPVAAVVFTRWRNNWGCDPVVLPTLAADILPAMWEWAVLQIEEHDIGCAEVAIEDGDSTSQALAQEHGFAAVPGTGVACWMATRTEGIEITPLPAGFRLADRSEDASRHHHFALRAGPAVAERLAQTSLYRSDLDLFVEDTSGTVAGYGLFWYDPVTRTGLVEPMRTVEGFERRGIARHILTAGLHRLASLGAERIKVNYEGDNDRARNLYLGTGFEAVSTATLHVGPG